MSTIGTCGTLHRYNYFEVQQYHKNSFVLKCILVKKSNFEAEIQGKWYYMPHPLQLEVQNMMICYPNET